MSEQSAFDALLNLAKRSLSSAKGLPSQADTIEKWSGVGFSLFGKRFVTPMGQIAELMEVPGTTRLPSVQPWVLGLSNVRGRLLPLFDLAQFFGGHSSSQKKHHRVLVLEVGPLYSGIVVDSSFGMQHFAVQSFTPSIQQNSYLPAMMTPYIEGDYKDASGERWHVFNITSLAEDPRFIDAAAG